MSLRRSRAAVLACSAFFASTAFVSAQTATSSFTPATTQDGEAAVLEKLNVKGARLGVSDTPLASTVTQTEIEDKQVQSISDLGRSLEPGVYFNRNNGAVNIRGLEGSRVLTTIDGIPLPYLSDATRSASGGVDTFDFTTLSTVDVVRGGDSSRTGSGALGGVLALQTLEPEDLIGEGRDWGGVAKFIYDGTDNSFTPSAGMAKRFGNTSVLFQGSYKSGGETESQGTIDTYGVTRTLANPSDYDQNNLLFKIRHHTESGHMFGLTAEQFRKDRTTDSRINQAFPLGPRDNYLPGNYTSLEDTERKQVSLDYRFESQSEDSLFDAASASFYWQDQLKAVGYNGYRSTTVRGLISRYNTNGEKTLGLIGTVEKSVVTGDFSHRFTVGYDVSSGQITQYSKGSDNCPKPLANGSYPTGFSACSNLHTNQADTPQVDTRRIGLYLDDAIAIGKSGWTITPGVRFDWFDYDPQDTASFRANANKRALPPGQNDSAISPKLRVAYQASESIEVFGQFARAFRAPTAGELYSSFGGPGTYLRLGNADLDSETGNTFDIGANLGDESFGGRINLYHNRYRNFIDTYSLDAAQSAALGYNLASYRQGGISSYYNIRRARIYGAELSVHKSFDSGFHTRGSLAYAKGENLDTGAFIQSVAPLKLVLGAGYAAENWGVDVDWIGVKRARGTSSYNAATGDRYFATPGYGIVDLTGWLEPEQVKGLKVNVGIYNVFDKTYYDYVSSRNLGTQPAPYYSEPGRSFKVSLTQRF